MKYDHRETVDLILSRLLETLVAAKHNFESIPLPRSGGRLISGISLDLHIQHGYVQISYRTIDEKWKRADIGDWKNQGFLSSVEGSCAVQLAQVAAVVHANYDCIPEDDLAAAQDRRHLLFFAAAEALLDRRVADTLNLYQIDAPYFGDHIGGYPFEYFVIDPDAGLKANYCDLVRSAFINRRLGI